MSKDESVKFARLQAQHDALKAKVEARDAADKRREDVAVAMQRFEGKVMGANLEERLVERHKQFGPEGFSAYVEDMVTTFASYEGESPDNSHTKPKPTTSAAVDKYAEQGPEAVARAAKFSAIWKQVSDAGQTQMTEDRYIAINMGQVSA